MENPRGVATKVEPERAQATNKCPRYLYTYMHQPNVRALLESAEAGCDVCEILCRTLRVYQDDAFNRVCAQCPQALQPNQHPLHLDNDTSAAAQLAEAAQRETASTEDLFQIYDDGRVVLEVDCDDQFGPRACSTDTDPQKVWISARATGLSAHWLNFFNNPYDPLDTELRNRPSRDLLSGPHIDLINRWRETCKKEHESCNRTGYNRPLPSRILELSDLGDTDDECGVRLVETHAEIQGAYVCLSYCWGDPEHQDQTGQTTRANLSTQLERISLNSMPETVVDAVRLCHRLSFRFLWVDRLCIIQDDEEDWEKEASKMCEIYSRSALTISTALCTKSSQSFLRRRMHIHRFDERGRFATINYIDKMSGSKACFSMIREALCRHKASWFLEEDWTGFVLNSRDPGNTWLTRGWTFQEWMLSPRVLHIDTMTLWDCYEGYANELNRRYMQRARLLRDAKYFGGAISWELIVEEYTSREIAYEKDRLPALAGLAARYQQTTGFTYLSGLWLEEMPRALLWRKPLAFEQAQAHASNDLPSWSWASMNGRALYGVGFSITAHAVEFFPSASIHGWSDPGGSAPVSAKEKAWVDIKGHMSTVIDYKSNEDESTAGDAKCQVKIGNQWWLSMEDCGYRYPADEIAQSNIHLLGLCSSVDPDDKYHGALVLQRCGWEDTRPCFRRLGFAYLRNEPVNPHDGWEPRDIRLI